MALAMDSELVDRIRALPILPVADALGIEIRKGKAMCFSGHDRSTPSLSFHKTKNVWKCYGCGEYGDSISLVEKVLGLSFLPACQWLCDRFSLSTNSQHARTKIKRRQSPVNVRPADVASIDAEAQPDPELYSWLVSKCAPVTDPRGIKYLEDHGIQMAAAELFGLIEMRDPKYAYMALEKKWGHDRLKACGLTSGRRALLWSGYALIFPFKNALGVHYLQVRCLEGNRKFIGPSGVTKPIFNHARLAALKPDDALHICEGIPDALALEGRGIAAVGILGATSFRNEWVEEFLPFELIGVPDGDGGGKAFRRCLSKAFHARSKSIAFVVLPAGEDASDVISRFTDA